MLYICYLDVNKTSLVGVKKKILSQCRIFEKELGTVYYTVYTGQTIYLLKNETVIKKQFALTRRECNDIIIKWIVGYEIQNVYIRYCFSDIWFIDFLKELKNRKIKSVLEFPTIPYDNEGGIFFPVEDRYYREQLYKYIDCCTTYGDYETVFKIPCIVLSNGVNINDHKQKEKREKGETITLIAVAALAKWHGYERIIMGMHNYYADGGKRNIIFNVVGEGGQLQYYKRITKECKLTKHVIFHGQLTGEKLDAVYDASDIAVGSLGFYKTGLQTAAPIKLREYCARGIPFIYGYHDISFNDANYFGYRVSNDSEPVDMAGVIDFYERTYEEKDFVRDMRQFTMENLTWDKILKPVIDYLQ